MKADSWDRPNESSGATTDTVGYRHRNKNLDDEKGHFVREPVLGVPLRTFGAAVAGRSTCRASDE
jgi:hypothetical protein